MVMLAAVLTAQSCIRQDGIPSRTKTDGPTGVFRMSEIGFSKAVEIVHGTRAENPDISTDDFLVEIHNKADGKEYLKCAVSELKDLMGEDMEMELPVGNYTITVESHKVKDAEWEDPYYRVTDSFEIKRGESTVIDKLVCSLANVMVSVSFTPDFRELMADDCVVEIFFGKGTLPFTPDESRAGFFKADDDDGEPYRALHWTFSGTVDGEEIDAGETIQDIAAGQHHKLEFDIQRTPLPGEGSVKFTFVVSVEVEVVDLNLNVVIAEKGIEDYDAAVQMSSPWATGSRHTVNLTEADDVKLGMSIEAEEGLRNVIVEFNVNGNEDLAKYFEDSGLGEAFDLANPGENLETLLGSFLLPTGDAVKGLEMLNLDFSAFIPKVFEFGNTPELDITVYARDTQGSLGSTTMRLKFFDDSEDPPITITWIDWDIDKRRVLKASEVLVSDPGSQTGVKSIVPIEIEILSDHGITEFTVDIESDNPEFSDEGLKSLGLAAHLDLANPGELKEGIDGLGFPTGDDVIGAKKLEFDITDFVPMMFMTGNSEKLDFRMTIKDIAGNDMEKTIKLTIVATE